MLNRYEITANVEFSVVADSEEKAFELADEKLVIIPNNISITGMSIRKGDEVWVCIYL